MTLDKQETLFNARNIALVLVLIGLVISGYLSYVKLLNVPIICLEDQIFSCDVVQSSKWSRLGGIPIAYLGFGSYSLIGMVLLLENRIPILKDNGRLIVFVLGLIGWLFSIWLVYIQAFIILAFCQWCLAHEFIFTLLFGVIIYRVWQDLK